MLPLVFVCFRRYILPFLVNGCKFIHKSLLEKYTGSYFTINECQLVYFCIFLKAYCCFVRIEKYIVLSALHLIISIYMAVRLSSGKVPVFCKGSRVQSSATSTIFSFLFFSRFS